MTLQLVSFVGAALFTVGGTWLVVTYARRKSILDHPGPRSLHSRPTPRGGGLAIVIATISAAALLWHFDRLDTELLQALAPGGVLIALIGWVDDHGHVPALARATAHTVAALLLIHFMGWPRTLDLGFVELSLGWAGPMVYVLSAVWVINLFNFMDGIDGIAAAQAALGFGVGSLLLLNGANAGLPLLAVTVAGASVGFLVWNRAPARIFMGDAGSGFLGYVVVFLALAGDRTGAVPLVVWMMLFGVFVFDATVTVVRRMLRGDQWYAAHRSHAYQRLVQAGRSHARVTSLAALLMAITMVFAVIAYHRRELLLPMLLLESAVLLGVYLKIERIWPMVEPEDI
jgi:Fuc2NAc and GlcNAc transferase